MNDGTVLSLDKVSKTFSSGDRSLEVLKQSSFNARAGESIAVVGPSGSGKTTLLGICAGLDTPTSGEIKLNGVSLGELSEDQRSDVRNRFVGFVFQNFQLLPTLTALENVMVPLELRGLGDVDQLRCGGVVDDAIGIGRRVHARQTLLHLAVDNAARHLTRGGVEGGRGGHDRCGRRGNGRGRHRCDAAC